MWNKTYDAKTADFHMNGRRQNANVYYSPGVDRMFAVDSLDPYTALEIAQILNSKVPGIAVCILTRDDVTINNLNCHEFTLKEKHLFEQSVSVLFNRHTPTIRKIKPQSLQLTDSMPLDYLPGSDKYNIFMSLKDYAQFVIQAWHAAKICEMYFNNFPMKLYADELIADGVIPADFNLPVDSSDGVLELGITKEIRKILYSSNNATEALDLIATMWRTNTNPWTKPWRDLFYNLIETPVPADLVSADMNFNRYMGFLL